MTAPVSQVSFGGVDISGYCTLGESGLNNSYALDPAGHADLYMSDGTLVRQVFFSKQQIIVAGTGTIPPELRALDLSTTQSLEIPDVEEAGGTRTYSVWATLQENHSVNASGAGRVGWTLTCREA
ncbi:MAG: hypothetical protein GY788_07490 [bacterium]|nr:hypothetical protein [bacterium]